MRQHENDDVSVFGRLDHIRYGDHILGQLVAGQIFNVLVVGVYDLGQLTAIHHLLVHVHFDCLVKFVVALNILANDFGDCGAPNLKSFLKSSI